MLNPHSQGLRIAVGVVLDHLAVWEPVPVQRDAQTLDAVGLRPPRRNSKTLSRPGQGFGKEAFGVIVTPQEKL